MSETFPQYDYKRYFIDIFPPNTDQNRIDRFLRKIKDLILVGNFESVGDDDDDDCFLLFKGQTVADISGRFPFPSDVFFDLNKTQIIGDLKYHSKSVYVIKPENCYLSIEKYQNRVVAVEKSAADNIIEDVAGKDSKADTPANEYPIDDKNLPIPKSSSKKLITNRQLNFTLFPVDKHNKKDFPYRLDNFEINRTWNHHQSIILDVIFDRIFTIVYQRYKTLPRSWRSEKTIEVVYKFSGGAVNPDSISYLNLPPIDAYEQKIGYDVREELKMQYDLRKDQMGGQISFDQFVENHFAQNKEYQEFKKTMTERVEGFYRDYPIRLSVVKLFEIYPLLKPYRYTLFDNLRKIEQTRFKMNYKVKFIKRKPSFDDKGKRVDAGQLIDLEYQMNDFQHLFAANAGKEEIVLNFDTPLGKLIIHNMLILDTDWWPVEAALLSKNAYFIYKRFVLNKVSGKRKAKTLELKFDELKAFLDLKWSNDRGVHAIIERALNSMVDNKMIVDYNPNTNLVKKRSYELHFENKQKDVKK